MLQYEFEKLAKTTVTFEVYEVINAMYMSNDMDKQEFVKKFMDMGLMGYAESRAAGTKKERQALEEQTARAMTAEREVEKIKSHFRTELLELKRKHDDFVRSIIINSHKLDKAFVDGECLRELGALQYYMTMRDAGCVPTTNDLDMFIKALMED